MVNRIVSVDNSFLPSAVVQTALKTVLVGIPDLLIQTGMNLRSVVTPSGTDDTAAVNTALAAFAAAGGGILTIPRDNWKFTGSTGLSLTGLSAPIHIKAQEGTVFDMTGSTAAIGMLLGGTANVTSAALGADAAKYAETITCSLTVVAGDVLKIQSTDVFDTEENQPKGELVEVLSSAAGVITLKDGLFDSYTAATTTVYMMLMPRVTVEGLEIVRNSNHQGLQVANARNVQLNGLHARGARERLFYLNTVFGGSVDHCKGSDFWYSGTGTSYGIVLASTQHITALGNVLRGGRHAVALGGTFPARDSTFVGGTYDNYHPSGQPSFNTHANVEGVKLVGVTALNGVGTHCSNFLAEGCTIRGVAVRAVDIYAPRDCQYVRLRNCDIQSGSFDGVAWLPRNSIAVAHATELVEIDAFIRAGGNGVSVVPVASTDTNSTIKHLAVSGDIQGAGAGVSITLQSSAAVTLQETELYGRFAGGTSKGIVSTVGTGSLRMRGKATSAQSAGGAVSITGFVDVSVDDMILEGTNTPFRNTFLNTGRLNIRNVTIDGASSLGGLNVSGPTEALITNLYRVNTTGTPTVPARTYESINAAGKVTASGTVAPTTGTWAVGDMCRNSAPTAGGTYAWICTTAGTPGTWSAWT